MRRIDLLINLEKQMGEKEKKLKLAKKKKKRKLTKS
jgi:hypothetical protein